MMRAAALALTLTVLAITGCAGGNSQYACPGLPGQPLCLSTTEIYRLSDGNGPPPAAEPRPSLLETQGDLVAGSGWAWTKRIWN